MSERVEVLLFVAGGGLRARSVEHAVRTAFDTHAVDADLTVIDVLQEPEKADEYKVMAAPTLLRVSPEPRARAVGDFTDAVAVIHALDLPAGAHTDD